MTTAADRPGTGSAEEPPRRPQAAAHIVSLGAYAPPHRMVNADWSAYVDTSDEWIFSRTGIRARRIAGPDESTATVAARAGRLCLEAAGFPPQDLRWILVSTDTPEMWNPATACFVQAELGAQRAVGLDVTGGCSGFVAALGLAEARASQGEPVLLIGCEVLSKAMDWSDRATAVLFGDGAAAALVMPAKPGDVPRGFSIQSLYARTDGRDADILGKPYGGTRNPLTPELVAGGHHHRIVMHGQYVFKNAVTKMADAAQQALADAGLGLDDVDWVVPHQANQRIIDAVAERLRVPAEKVFSNVREYANTGSASIGIALAEAIQRGLIRPGQTVLTVAFGSGFSWAASVWRVESVPPVGAALEGD
jgi:3-oxoacyl-[acyl-carrier-protein] synthase-3